MLGKLIKSSIRIANEKLSESRAVGTSFGHQWQILCEGIQLIQLFTCTLLFAPFVLISTPALAQKLDSKLNCKMDFAEMQSEVDQLRNRHAELTRYMREVSTTPGRKASSETVLPSWVSDFFSDLQMNLFGQSDLLRLTGTKMRVNAMFDETNMVVMIQNKFLADTLKIDGLKDPKGLVYAILGHEAGHLVQNFILHSKNINLEEHIDLADPKKFQMAFSCAHAQVDIYGLMMVKPLHEVKHTDVLRFLEHTAKTADIPKPDQKGFQYEMRFRQQTIRKYLDFIGS